MSEGLSNSVRTYREAQGWTQAELAERTGVSRKTVNTVENGVFVPSVVVAMRLSKALGQPVEVLFQLREDQAGAGPLDPIVGMR